MSTRGLFGLRYNNTDKLSYSPSDSYPSNLGSRVIETIKLLADNELVTMYNLMQDADEEEAEWDFSHWKVLTKDNKPIPYYHDNKFIRDSLYCEYAYIINLDNNTLEFYIGFQEKPQKGNRYGEEVTYVGSSSGTEYYPCKLAKVFTLDEVRTTSEDDLLDVMRNIKEEDRNS